MSPILQLARVFLKLGVIGFGGPAAHIAMMEEEVVSRRKWLSREEFVDLLGATNLIPGPNSTEMAIHIGHRRAGYPGLIVAGCSFILPAVLLVMLCAWGYVRFGTLPAVEGILYGIKPVIIAIVFHAIWRLVGTTLKTKLCMVVCLAVFALGFLQINELALLFGGGLAVGLCSLQRGRGKKLGGLAAPFWPGHGLLATAAAPAAAAAVAVPFGLWPLFLFFLKIGSVLYGSGYVLLAFLRSGLVERLGWLSENELLDAIAVGQFTPGPVFTTATFVGYLLGGPVAALVATVGIFLPAFVFVAASGPLVPRIRRSPVAGAFLDGVNAASLALMATVTCQLARAAITDWATLPLALFSGLLLVRWKLNSAWLVALGALVGLIKVIAT